MPFQRMMITQNEEKLRQDFLAFLRSQPDRFKGVRAEADRIDVAFVCDGERQVAELKSYLSFPTMHHALRAGLGQLLSYNYGPKRSPARGWWLVLDSRPDESAKAFIQKVAVAHQMPLVIAHRTNTTFKIWDPLLA